MNFAQGFSFIKISLNAIYSAKELVFRNCFAGGRWLFIELNEFSFGVSVFYLGDVLLIVYLF